MNQGAWEHITRAMDTLKTVIADQTVCNGCRFAATSAWLDLFYARNALLADYEDRANVVVSDGK